MRHLRLAPLIVLALIAPARGGPQANGPMPAAKAFPGDDVLPAAEVVKPTGKMPPKPEPSTFPYAIPEPTAADVAPAYVAPAALTAKIVWTPCVGEWVALLPGAIADEATPASGLPALYLVLEGDGKNYLLSGDVMDGVRSSDPSLRKHLVDPTGIRRPQDVLKDMRQVEATHRGQLEFHLRRGLLQQSLIRVNSTYRDASILDLTEVLRQDPHHALAYLERARSHVGPAFESLRIDCEATKQDSCACPPKPGSCGVTKDDFKDPQRRALGRAVGDLLMALTYDPELDRAYRVRAMAQEARRRYDLATADYAEVLRREPDLDHAKEGICRIETRQLLADAIAEAESALADAETQIKAGKKAVERAEKAKSLVPDQQVANHTTEAQKQFKEILNINTCLTWRHKTLEDLNPGCKRCCVREEINNISKRVNHLRKSSLEALNHAEAAAKKAEDAARDALQQKAKATVAPSATMNAVAPGADLVFATDAVAAGVALAFAPDVAAAARAVQEAGATLARIKKSRRLIQGLVGLIEKVKDLATPSARDNAAAAAAALKLAPDVAAAVKAVQEAGAALARIKEGEALIERLAGLIKETDDLEIASRASKALEKAVANNRAEAETIRKSLATTNEAVRAELLRLAGVAADQAEAARKVAGQAAEDASVADAISSPESRASVFASRAGQKASDSFQHSKAVAQFKNHAGNMATIGDVNSYVSKAKASAALAQAAADEARVAAGQAAQAEEARLKIEIARGRSNAFRTNPFRAK